MAQSAATFFDSLWYAGSAEPAREADAPADADLVVVGGGYTGLSAALHVAQAGHSVTLFEAREVGFGASGRNGGQVIPGFKHDPDAVIARFGPEAGEALIRLGGEAAELVFGLIARHGIACQPRRNGWIQASHSEIALETVRARAAQWQDRGVDARVLSRDEIAEMSGATCYAGGWLDPRAGQIQPLAYARGLARAAQNAGVRIVSGCPVTDLRSDGDGWRVTAAHGTTRTGRVLLATGAYSDGKLLPSLPRSILRAQSNIVVTAPLEPAQIKAILPFGGCLSEIRKLAFYIRLSEDGRLVMGGRGAIGDSHGLAHQKRLEWAMRRMFPQVGDLPVEYVWSGQVALTMDGWPHLHQPQRGLYTVLGYNGRGVAMSTAVGAMIADHLAADVPLYLSETPLRAIPWHALRAPVTRIGIGYYWLKDSLGLAS
ncbi:NAD(P)/FAD-dependent oxidoreductase [Roseovarius sp. B08]|uniref:NAD(P)/FAD-dependent oxidoreductase n=1 Tax=Roseovarius sp. B08 TaxID=3449223 RepID=UPI003EDB9E26